MKFRRSQLRSLIEVNNEPNLTLYKGSFEVLRFYWQNPPTYFLFMHEILEMVVSELFLTVSLLKSNPRRAFSCVLRTPSPIPKIAARTKGHIILNTPLKLHYNITNSGNRCFRSQCWLEFTPELNLSKERTCFSPTSRQKQKPEEERHRKLSR